MNLSLRTSLVAFALASQALVGCKSDSFKSDTDKPRAAPSASASGEHHDPTDQLGRLRGKGIDVDVCGMFSKEVLKAATGVEFIDGTPSRGGNSADCYWFGGTPTLRVRVTESRHLGEVLDTARASDEKAAKAKGEDVPGVGDKAYIVTGIGGKETHVKLGAVRGDRTIVIVTVDGIEVPKAKQAAQTLAKQAFAKRK